MNLMFNEKADNAKQESDLFANHGAEKRQCCVFVLPTNIMNTNRLSVGSILAAKA
jgi:hypothetical protein